jgi:allantoinase
VFLPDLVVRSRRVLVNGDLRPAAVHIRGGRIIGVLDHENAPEGCPINDAGELVVMPGLVDAHTVIDPTGGDYRTAFDRAARAAAAGGVTTLIDLGVPSCPTASVSALADKRRDVAGCCFVNIGWCGTLVPGNGGDVAPLAAAGVFGFACALASPSMASGCALSEADVRAVMPGLTRLGMTLMASAQSADRIDRSSDERSSRRFGDRLTSLVRRRERYSTFMDRYPKSAETDAVVRLLELCRQHNTRTHILNLSSSDALTPIFNARATRVPVTAETCPPYLFFAAEDLPERAGIYKCVPPIRDRVNRELLWGALSGGLVQVVSSGPFGGASAAFSLSATWTAAAGRGHAVTRLADWLCRGPSRALGIANKGEIAVGYDADLVVWNPDASFTVDVEPGRGARTSLSAYAGHSLRGVVTRVYLRGTAVYADGMLNERPVGRILERPSASRRD